MFYRTRKLISNILSGVLAFLIVAVGFFAIITTTLNIVYIKTSIEGYSMIPTFNLNVDSPKKEGDVIYINRFKNFKVGDVVVAELGDKFIIKRLIGCPGDTIEIKDEGVKYGLYVNDNPLYYKEKTTVENSKYGSSERYYKDLYLRFFEKEQFQKNIKTKDNGDKCIVLNNDEYFLMGDNWGKTSDSLSSGAFHKKDIVGKVDIVVPYGEKEDVYILKTISKMLFN